MHSYLSSVHNICLVVTIGGDICNRTATRSRNPQSKGLFICVLCRLSENSLETSRKLYRILAGGEEVSFLDPAHGEDAVVLLVCDSPRLSEHGLRSRRALRPALVPHGVSL